MRRKTIDKCKLIINVISKKGHSEILTESVFDNRTKKFWKPEQIAERGILWFLDMADMKESLNWNLNGDSSKYQFAWGQSGELFSSGCAYIYD